MVKYSLKNLLMHSDSIYQDSMKHFNGINNKIKKEFDNFNIQLDAMLGNNEYDKLSKNVSFVLSSKFTDHLISMYHLSMRGLITDAIVCERCAIELILYHWLIKRDEIVRHSYNEDKELKFHDLKRELNKHGVNISFLVDLYAYNSKFAHAPRREHERNKLKMNNDTSPPSGEVSFGGKFDKESISLMLNDISALLHLFWNDTQ